MKKFLSSLFTGLLFISCMLIFVACPTSSGIGTDNSDPSTDIEPDSDDLPDNPDPSTDIEPENEAIMIKLFASEHLTYSGKEILSDFGKYAYLVLTIEGDRPAFFNQFTERIVH